MKYFDSKLCFCINLTIHILKIKKISNISFLSDFYADFIYSGNYDIAIKNNLSDFLKLIKLMSFFDENASYIRLLKAIDFLCFKTECYDIILNFYEDIIEYKEFYDNEFVVLVWLNYFDSLIKEKEKREDDKLKYYEIYFKIIKVSIDRIEILPVHILPQLTINNFIKVKDNLLELLYLLSIKEKISSLNHIFLKLNELCLDLNISELESQSEIIDMYSFSLLSSMNSPDSKIISFIINKYIDLIKELDKNKLISEKLAKHIVDNIKEVIFEYIEKNHKYADTLMNIFSEFVSTSNDFHFIKPLKQNLYKYAFEMGMKAIENGLDNFIKYISNFIGWGVQSELEKKITDSAKKYYRYGYDLFSTLVIVNYNESVTNFVGTFFITIFSYCYSDQSNYLLIRFANERIKDFDKNMFNVLYKSLSLRKSTAYTWNEVFNAKFDEGLLKLCDKLSLK